ncbi:MAG: hypothetical protein M3413_03680, partial [Bacteroidota bacterium]|nr:hypothetical protein [Bacteroidota bacterium]
MRIIIITITMHLLCIISPAQDIKLGKINTPDLEKKEYIIDPEANAVILSDVGSSELVGNKKGWFSIAFTR